MHLRCFELARDALNSQGFCVIGGYMSAVNDAYKKKGLISAKHRIAMCHLACKSSDFVMVDPWEASQITYQRSLTVLSRIKTSLLDSGLASSDSLKVMLLCGSDLLESLSTPGVWIPEQVSSFSRFFKKKKVHLAGFVLTHHHTNPICYFKKYKANTCCVLTFQVRTICRDFGLVCIRRDCQDVENIIAKDDILNSYKVRKRIC
nr:nicotinamide/nicotinic acid mononucleotide adenylyltransferase isoform X2 [Ipomoea batatas]